MYYTAIRYFESSRPNAVNGKPLPFVIITCAVYLNNDYCDCRGCCGFDATHRKKIKCVSNLALSGGSLKYGIVAPSRAYVTPRSVRRTVQLKWRIATLNITNGNIQRYGPYYIPHLSHLSWPSPCAGPAIILFIQYFRSVFLQVFL